MNVYYRQSVIWQLEHGKITNNEPYNSENQYVYVIFFLLVCFNCCIDKTEKSFIYNSTRKLKKKVLYQQLNSASGNSCKEKLLK